MKKTTILLLISLFNIHLLAAKFATTTSYQLCFTPNGNCTGNIVSAIKAAQKTILVQAYSFTSKPILWALVDAYKRDVNVRMILDKSDADSKYSGISMLKRFHIPFAIDYMPEVTRKNSYAIAHNKVMIIDDKTVVTGSFNFTYSAQNRNAENSLIVVNAPKFAAAYTKNWKSRAKRAVSLVEFNKLKDGLGD